MLLMLTNIQKNAGAEVPSLANAAREMSRFVERAGRVCSGKRCREFGQFKGNGRCCLLDSALSLSLSPRFTSLFTSRRPQPQVFLLFCCLSFSCFSLVFSLSLPFFSHPARISFSFPLSIRLPSISAPSRPVCLCLIQIHSKWQPSILHSIQFNSIRFVTV